VTIANTVYTLVEGENTITLNGINQVADAPTLQILFGVYVDGGSQNNGEIDIISTGSGSFDVQIDSITESEANGNVKFNEEGKVLTEPDTWFYWNDQNWCGSNVAVNTANVDNGAITFDYSGANDVCWFGAQLFYHKSGVTVGNTYNIQFDVVASAACNITVSGTVVNLQAGTNHVSVDYTLESNKAVVNIQFGVHGSDANSNAGAVLGAGNFVISGLAITEKTENGGNEGNDNQGGQTADVKEVTFASPNTYGEYYYEFVVTTEADLSTTSYVMVNGVRTPMYENLNGGVFKVYVGDITLSSYEFKWYDSSDQLIAQGTYTVATNNGGNENNNGNVSAGAVTIALTYEETYNDHYFRFTLGGDFDISTAGYVAVNGVQEWSEYTADSRTFKVYVDDINLSEYKFEWYKDGKVIAQGIYTVATVDNGGNESSESQYVTVGDSISPTGTEITFGSEGDSTSNLDKWVYWYVQDAGWGCGSVVTMTKAEIENGAIVLTYNGGSEFYSTQLFYNTSSLTSGSLYRLTLTINASVAGSVKVNDKEVTLVAGDNTVSVDFTLGGISAVDIQFAGTSAEVTYKVSDVSWIALQEKA
jgi:hypothetical protein